LVTVTYSKLLTWSNCSIIMGGGTSIVSSYNAQSVTPQEVVRRLIDISDEYVDYEEQILANKVNIDSFDIEKVT